MKRNATLTWTPEFVAVKDSWGVPPSQTEHTERSPPNTMRPPPGLQQNQTLVQTETQSQNRFYGEAADQNPWRRRQRSGAGCYSGCTPRTMETDRDGQTPPPQRSRSRGSPDRCAAQTPAHSRSRRRWRDTNGGKTEFCYGRGTRNASYQRYLPKPHRPADHAGSIQLHFILIRTDTSHSSVWHQRKVFFTGFDL